MTTLRALQTLARSLLQAVPTVVGVILLSFFLLQAVPGDAADVIAAESGSATEASMAAMRSHFGLDQPVLRQLQAYVRNLFELNLGISPRYNLPVSDLIFQPARQHGAADVQRPGLRAGGGHRAGRADGELRGRWPDRVLSLAALLLYSTPGFWLGLMAIILLSVQLGWLPPGGVSTIGSSATGLAHALDVARHLVLPTLALAGFYVAIFARLTRASMLEVSRQDFVRTARAKGLTPWAVARRHILRNALIPVTTVAGLNFGTLLGGAVVVETVFSWPGLGPPGLRIRHGPRLRRAARHPGPVLAAGHPRQPAGRPAARPAGPAHPRPLNPPLPILSAMSANASSRPAPAPSLPRPRSRARRLLANPAAVAGGFLLLLILLAAVTAPWIFPHDPLDMVGPPILWPGQDPAFPLGTDTMGRDIAAGLAHGARVSLAVGVTAALLSLAIGIAVGAAAGYAGGWVDAVLMRATELLQTIPSFLLVVVIVAIGRPSVAVIALSIGVASWPVVARLVRAEFRSCASGIRAGGAQHRLQPFPHRPAGNPAQRAAARDRHHLGAGRQRHPHRIGPVLHEHGRPQRGLLGQHDRRRPRNAAHRLVPGGAARPVHRADGAVAQPAGRRAERRPSIRASAA